MARRSLVGVPGIAHPARSGEHRQRWMAGLVDAELVSFGIRHDHEVALFLNGAKPVGAERRQPLHEGVDLFGAIRAAGRRGGEIEVNPVLDRLRLGNTLEEHPGPDSGGIFDGEGGVEILLGPALRPEEVVPSFDIRRRIRESGGPERSRSRRIQAVERDLKSSRFHD